MNKFTKAFKKEILPIIGLISFLSLFRLMPHPMNFTPILAVGIFSGFYFKNFFLSSFIIIFAMFIGDLYLGLHSTMIFVYVSLMITVLLGLFIKKFKSKEILLTGLLGSISFFLITNFGAWISLTIYEKSFAGLLQAYVLAIPFFQNTLISTILYLFIIKLIFNFFVEKKINKFSF